ncbi:phosphatase PAP2 family protein [Gordonia sp. DT218]|uniref:phosphatase PAP2 family protein n=1 Tax=unclassified Gordonia (in: high G+C Gram-positive bacteria) TaxID=2657482 RepID=UPI003CEF7C16
MRSTQLRTIAGLLLMAAVCVFGIGMMLDGMPLGLDDLVMNATVAWRSPAVTSVVGELTLVFSPLAVTVWTACAAAFFVIRDHAVRRAFPLVASVAAAGLIGEIIKIVVHRHRPPIADQLGTLETTYSFPSGHVTGTTAFVFALALIATTQSTRLTRIAALSAAGLITLVAACTRIYLGVHWVTDVVAGVCAGLAVALAVPIWAEALLRTLSRHSPDNLRRYIVQVIPQRPTSDNDRHPTMTDIRQ